VKYTNVLQLSRAVRIRHPVNNKTRLNAVMAGGNADDTGRRVFDVTGFRSRATDERDDAGFDGGGTQWPKVTLQSSTGDHAHLSLVCVASS